VELTEQLVYALSRQRRFEEAQRVREARDHLLSVRRSYQSLAEARSLRFAALWPAVGEGGSAALRLNLVWNGRLRDAVSLPSSSVAEGIEDRLHALWAACSTGCTRGADTSMAVAQKDLDALLAVRRWYKESEASSVLTLPGPDAGLEERERARERLLAEAWRVLAMWPAGRAAGPVL
jgi:hypothetical protein